KRPEKVDMIIFRENTEDIYAGIDYQAGTPEAKKILDFVQRELPAAFKKIRFGAEAADQIGIGIKPVSRPGTERLARAALEYAVIATLNMNGDYLSDALAAQVGGIGIAPGGNINYISGHAIFEATHGTAPKYANQDRVNPGSVVLSGEMMLRYLGWGEAADLILKGLNGAISSKRVTYDFARQMQGA